MPFRAHSLSISFEPTQAPPPHPVAFAAPPPPDPAIDELRRLIAPADGTVLVPGVDPDAAKLLPFNRRTLMLPRVIVSCQRAAAISIALDWARRHRVPLRGHSGGHSYEGFCSVAGLMIDVRPMDELTVDLAQNRALVGAGHRLLDLTTKLFAQGVAIPLGTCAPVGIAGVTLGGGHGLASRKFGLTLDNLRSAKIVLADGREVTASDRENPDLFWALRGGGGGNFGIVTEFEFNVHRVKRVILFRIKWRPSASEQAMVAWQAWIDQVRDEISAVMVLSGGPSGISGARCVGQFLPTRAGQVPDPAELRRLLQPLSDITHTEFTVRETDYLQAAKYFAGSGDTERVYFKAKSDYALETLSDRARHALLSALRNSARPVDVIFEGYGGAINRVASTATAFPHRGRVRFCMQYYAEWRDAASTTATVRAVTAVHTAMRPYLPGSSYVNYTDLDLADWARAYYGSNLNRLIQIKNEYDPTNVFNFAQSVPTSRLGNSTAPLAHHTPPGLATAKLGDARTEFSRFAGKVDTEAVQAFMSSKEYLARSHPYRDPTAHQKVIASLQARLNVEAAPGAIPPVPGGVGYGMFYEPTFITAYTSGTALMWEIICPMAPGGNVTDWLYLTATNRATKGVEAFVSYFAQAEPHLKIFDWARPDQTRFQTDIPFRALRAYLQSRTVHGQVNQTLTVLNITRDLGSGSWRNEVWLYQAPIARWDLIYSYDYAATLAEQQDTTFSWGPIVETFQDAYQGTNPMGTVATKLSSCDASGAWSSYTLLAPSQATLRDDQKGFIQLFLDPQHTWVVDS